MRNHRKIRASTCICDNECTNHRGHQINPNPRERCNGVELEHGISDDRQNLKAAWSHKAISGHVLSGVFMYAQCSTWFGCLVLQDQGTKRHCEEPQPSGARPSMTSIESNRHFTTASMPTWNIRYIYNNPPNILVFLYSMQVLCFIAHSLTTLSFSSKYSRHNS